MSENTMPPPGSLGQVLSRDECRDLFNSFDNGHATGEEMVRAVEALTLQKARASTTHVAVPTTVDTAKMMVLLGTDYLQRHAPGALKPPQQSAQPVEIQALICGIHSAKTMARRDYLFDQLPTALESAQPVESEFYKSAKYVYDTFKADLDRGFSTRDKVFAVGILGEALAAAQPVEVQRVAYWPVCSECKKAFEFDAQEPFAYCGCGCTEWGNGRPVERRKVQQPVEVQRVPLTPAQLNEGLKLHRLTWDKPSQLADGFRAGANWGYNLK